MRMSHLSALAGSFVIVVLGAQSVPHAISPAAQDMPRDARPASPSSATTEEAALRKKLSENPSDVRSLMLLAALQERRGAIVEAEAALLKARELAPSDAAAHQALGAFYGRQGQFDRAVELLERAAALDPTNPVGHHLVASYYQEKAQKDEGLSAADRLTYIERGLAAEDRALDVKPDYVDALVYKNILLRMQANLETDAGRRQVLIDEANALRNRAMELNKQRGISHMPRPDRTSSEPPAPPPPPPPPPPPCPPGSTDGGRKRCGE